MSSREIAELCEKQTKHVHRDILAMLDSLYPDGPNLDHEGISITYDHRGYIVGFYLDYSHTVTLITGYRADLRKRVINRWMELDPLDEDE